jgi:high affinity sulfate transporter 1
MDGSEEKEAPMTSAPPAPAAKGTFGVDLIAGLTAAAVVIPKAMAYATVAGLPVVVGLYTAFVPMVVYALLGSSKVMNVSTTTTLAILTGAQLALVVPDGDPARLLTASATLAVLTGLLLMLAGVLRLGVVADFISDPVLTGFKAGVGLVIILDQVPKLLGVHFKKADFFHNLWALGKSLPDTSMLALGIGVAVILVLVVIERLLPKLPAPLLALGGAIGASAAFGLGARGIETVGLIPRGFPSFVLPDVDLIRQLLPGAAGIALMSFVESIACGRAFARTDEPAVRANRELLATGAANLGGAFFGSMPAGGGTSQTAVVRAVGGRSQTASLVTAGTAVLVMLLLAPVLGLIPNSALAALVIVYSVGLIQPGEFIAIRKIRTMEFRWAMAACLGVPLFGTLQGIVLSIGISLLTMLARASNPRLSVLGRKPGTDVFRPITPEHPEDETFPGLLLVRPEDRIFFGNVQTIRERLTALVDEKKPRVLGLDLRIVPDIEYSALKVLIEAEKKTAAVGIKLWLIGLSSEVLLVVQRSGLAERLGREGMFFNCQAAVARFQSLPAPEPPKQA